MHRSSTTSAVAEPELSAQPEQDVEPEQVVESTLVVEPELVADSPSESWLNIGEQFGPESVYFDETAFAAEAATEMGTDADEQPDMMAEVAEAEPVVFDEAGSDEDRPGG